MGEYKSILHEMVSTTKTEFWNDSCSFSELKNAVENGATGATTNPVIVGNVLKLEMDLWKKRIHEIIDDNKTYSEIDVVWKLNEEMAVKGAEVLLPVFKKTDGKKGRLSIQTNVQYYRDAKKMTEQAIYFSKLAKNIQVKLPVTKAGIEAIEEATYNGVNINATVSFTVAQSIAVAEAVERGLRRREKEGKDTSDMSPVCTLMAGRLDDWLKTINEKKKMNINPKYIEYAGLACLKKAYEIYRKNGYKTRMLTAAFRNLKQWHEMIGGDIVLTINSDWQKKINNSGLKIENNIDNPVPSEILNDLYRQFDDFRKAYDEDGLTIEQFDSYGAVEKTLRWFLYGYGDLIAVIRDLMISDPDLKI